MKLSFITPTQIDLREIFTLGLGSKRGDDGKIGHKGSGLKFTLALLHRLGTRLEVRVRGEGVRHHYLSEARTIVVRGVEHQVIVLVPPTGSQAPELETHISITAGADTWAEPWFALRELLQNTLDEGGGVYAYHEPPVDWDGEGTALTIELTPDLEAAWQTQCRWYNARHPEVVYLGEKPGLFYHGFLVYDDPTWVGCYDVTTILERSQLSEDRQLRNVDLAKVFKAVVEKTPALPPIYYREFLNAGAGSDIEHMSHAIYNPIYKEAPDFGGFKMVELEAEFIRQHGEKACYCDGSGEAELYHAAAAGYKVVVRMPDHGRRLLRYSKIPCTSDLMPAIEKRLQPVSPKNLPTDALGKLKLALRLTKSLRPAGCTVQIVKETNAHDKLGAVAMALMAENKVLLLESHVVSAPVLDLVDTLVHEFVHISSRGSDCSQTFESALIRIIAQSLMPKARARKEEVL